jgi:uncharacterized protein (DUF1499 family)
MLASTEARRRSIAADIAFACSVLGLALLALAPLCSYLGVLSPFVGFALAGGALPLALAALGAGIVGLVRTRKATGRGGRGRAWVGFAYGAGLIGLGVVLLAVRPRLPRINDITTDMSDPPRFVAALRAPENAGRDLAYPAGFAPEQRAGYPDVRPILLDVPPRQAFERALAAARALGWTIVETSPERGQIEAKAISRVFHFVDDIVVRVRPSAQGSVVDVRSKSRDGKGDWGVNAARIRAFDKKLR